MSNVFINIDIEGIIQGTLKSSFTPLQYFFLSQNLQQTFLIWSQMKVVVLKFRNIRNGRHSESLMRFYTGIGIEVEYVSKMINTL